MSTKITAAVVATEAGIDCCVINGSDPGAAIRPAGGPGDRHPVPGKEKGVTNAIAEGGNKNDRNGTDGKEG